MKRRFEATVMLWRKGVIPLKKGNKEGNKKGSAKDDDRAYFVSYFPDHPPVVSKETVQVGIKLGPGRDQVTAQVLNFCQELRNSSELMGLIGFKHWKTFQANYLKPLLQQGILAMIIPEKPTSSKQRYVTTKTGNEVLKR